MSTPEASLPLMTLRSLSRQASDSRAGCLHIDAILVGHRTSLEINVDIHRLYLVAVSARFEQSDFIKLPFPEYGLLVEALPILRFVPGT